MKTIIKTIGTTISVLLIVIGLTALFTIDNAQGLSKELFDKIYEPYFTTKHQSIGTGLGLFICKIVIENSFKGEIMHENISNGLKFTLKFPKIV